MGLVIGRRRANSPPAAAPQFSRDAVVALVAALVGGIVSLIGQYFISYLFVERPKFILEQSKLELEVLRSFQQLAPNVTVECKKAEHYSGFYVLDCTAKNHGAFSVRIDMKTFRGFHAYRAHERGDLENTLRLLQSSSSFPIDVVNGQSATLRFHYDLLDKKDAFVLQQHAVRVALTYKTADEITETFSRTFPHMATHVNKVAAKTLVYTFTPPYVSLPNAQDLARIKK